MKREEILLSTMENALISIKIMQFPEGSGVASNLDLLKIMEGSFEKAIEEFNSIKD